MNFPCPLNFIEVDRKKKYAANRKKKVEAFKAEVVALRERQQHRAAQELEKNPPKRTYCSPELTEFILSKGFLDWYEEVTRKSGAQFADMLLNCDESYLFGLRRDVWAVRRIQRLFDEYRWQRPHYRRYWATNLHKCTDPCERRAIILRLATPKWANLYKVARIHHERARITAETGIPHHVDHIIPLQGLRVCGLNNEFNLRIITAAENCSKSNKYEIR